MLHVVFLVGLGNLEYWFIYKIKKFKEYDTSRFIADKHLLNKYYMKKLIS